jgi:hypothetical protein
LYCVDFHSGNNSNEDHEIAPYFPKMPDILGNMEIGGQNELFGSDWQRLRQKLFGR